MTAAGHPGVDLERLRGLFLEEAHEHSAALEAGVLAMEANPNDQELTNDVFRAAHSLKGAAGAIGFQSLADLTHALETLLDCWRSGELQPMRAHADALLKACDAIRQLLENGPEHPGAAQLSPELCVLRAELEALANDANVGAAPVALTAEIAAPATAHTYCVKFAPKSEAFHWGADPLLVLRELNSISSRYVVELSETIPDLAQLNAETCYMAWRIELELLGDADRNTLDEAFMFVQDVAVVSIEALEPDDVAPELRIADSTASSPSEGKSARSSTEAATIRVATEKIDKLVDLVGELVIAHSAVRELSKHPTPERLASLQEAVLQTERHLRELQERVMSVRMVPMGTVFSRLARTVREASGKLGKQVQLELDGNDTELDKGLAERLGDPLLHLVRNAVDHGLESPEARAAAGKPSVGKLRIVARPRGGSVVVEVSDDGRGLNREKILKRAIERGLVASDAVLTDEQIYALISSAGFSTAETVTDLSGRGVGLDVVKRNIAEMGGDLTIRSEPGRGSTFTIRLPLTLTIMEGLLLKAGNTVCVVPLVDVAFSLRLRPEQQRSLAGLGQILDLPGESLPILELVDLLSLPPRSGGGELAVVLQTGSHRYALRVDALLGQTQVVVKSLETHFRRLPGILGATILGDGRVALILDGAGLAAVAGLDVNERLQAPTLLTHAETNSWN